MSHFTVLVIGNDYEAQLAPFHQFECTGINDEYVQDIDITDDARAGFARSGDKESFAEYVAGYYGTKLVPFGELPDTEGAHMYGYALADADGEVTKVVDRTNPNRRWDWYQLGGRWSGFFRLKPGAEGIVGAHGVMGSCRNDGPEFCDQAKKRDIDFEGLRSEAALEAERDWDMAWSLRNGSAWETWPTLRERLGVEAAREIYHQQPTLLAVKASEPFLRWYEGLDDLLQPRDVYVQRARDNAISTFAVLKDGKWHERGRMGWWACVSDEKDEGDWNREFNALLDSLPDDTTLSVVDCHI